MAPSVQPQARPLGPQSGAPAPGGMLPQAAASPSTSGTDLRPLQMMPSPPRVSYAGGALTVVANNSTLTDVLKAISNITGAKVEGLTGSADRVYGQFGPGSPRAVLDMLLQGSHYDFILVGAVEDPEAVQQVILSPHVSTPSPGTQTAYTPNRPNPPNPSVANDENDNSQDASDEGQPLEPPPNLAQPQNPPNGNPPNGNPQQNGAKSPEQLLEELRRLNRVPDQSPRQTQQPPPQPPPQ